MAKKTPSRLWEQARAEHPTDADARANRYVELMRAEGHIIEREKGDDSPLMPCGWDPSRGLDQLLTDEQHKQLNADLAEMARRRRRAEAAARNWPMP